MQDRALEQALDELTELLRQHKDYCPKIRAILQAVVQNSVDNCCGKEGWRVVSDSGASDRYVVTERSGREHTVVFDRPNTNKPVSCSCHEFMRMEVMCVGIAAVLKSQEQDPFDVQWLPEQWRLAYHPLWQKAMLRLCPMPASTTQDQNDDQGGQGESMDDDDDSRIREAVVARWVKVSAIPTPTTANLRRAQMGDAFFALRDDFGVAESPDKYRAVMASIFDLRGAFRGTPGCWLQDAPPLVQPTVTAYNGDALAQAPLNQANFGKPRQQTVHNQASMTVREQRKKRARGDFPTVAERRELSGDWTLFTPTNGATTFMCPIPGCMNKPIKNCDQSRYHHRTSAKHQACLKQYPRDPRIAATVVPASVTSGGQGAHPSSPRSGIPGGQIARPSSPLSGIPGGQIAHPTSPRSGIPGGQIAHPTSPLSGIPGGPIAHPTSPLSGIPGGQIGRPSDALFSTFPTNQFEEPVSPPPDDSLPPLPNLDDSQNTVREKINTRAQAAISRYYDAKEAAAAATLAVPVLPDFARARFPTDVPPEQIIWHAWGDCMAEGVGLCRVWNVYNANRVFDNVAVELISDPGRYNTVKRTIECTARNRTVYLTEVGKIKRGQRRNKVTFTGTCDAFITWALGKCRRSYIDAHNQLFRENNLVLVECGTKGNCLYHSCIFLLKTFLPEARVGSSRAADLTHMDLRQATVEHLQTQYASIRIAPHMPVLSTIQNQVLANGAEQALPNDVVMGNYCATHMIEGEYGEDPCIAAFAHLMGLHVVVFHTTVAEPCEFNAGASSEVLRLWCNGAHYMVRTVLLILVKFVSLLHRH